MSRLLICVSVLWALCFPVVTSAEEASHLPESVIGFFESNCYDCHSSDLAKGELDLESMAFNPSDREGLTRWSWIYDRVKHGEMPPKGEPEGKSAFLSEIEETLHRHSQAHQEEKGRVRSRRLSRVEFENTLHDLLGIDLPVRDLLPEDARQEGFSNVAESQSVSYHLLEKYMEVVDVALDEAFQRATQPVPTYKRNFKARKLADDFAKKARRDRRPIFKDGYAVAIAANNNYHGRMSATAVPETGWYRFTVKAKAFNLPEDRPGVWTQIRSGVCSARAPRMFWVDHFLAEPELKDFTFDAWMLKGHRLEIRPGDRTLKFARVQSVNSGRAVDQGAIGTAIKSIQVERVYKGGTVEEVRNRLFASLKVVDGELVSEQVEQDLEKLLLRFAEHAFRRPVSPTVIEPYLNYAQATLTEGVSLVEALRVGYRALLSSPRFLFFREDLGRLDDASLASRLSYMLWSRPPDKELATLVRQQRLTNPDELAKQVDRLLQDPRSEGFVKNFTDTWLSLKDIDFTSPDRSLYPEFDDILKASMLEETRAYLREMIDANLSVTHVIDSDFAMLNERLAKHYGIEGVRGSAIQRVALQGKEHRGGLITQGSVLKVTANGTSTSPIVRGVWLLERILGEHVPPPPDDVPAVEPDIRGAINIRDQLDKHRSQKSCMACHQKIDPPGFALENYDVIGGWRDHYRAIQAQKKWWKRGQPVDASYQMPDGQAFDNIEGFKRIALAHPDKLARNLVHKLLVYGTGASIEFADRREIDRIVKELAKDNYGFRSLIHQVVQSTIFRSK